MTKPARTLLDLASTGSERFIAGLLDDALRRRLVSLSFLDAWLADPGRARHRGGKLLRQLIGERAVHGVTDSDLETKALTLFRAGGLPTPTLQYAVADIHGRILARVDLAYPAQRVGIELDGFQFHDTRDSFDSERARGNELQVLGWNILRLTDEHLERRPDQVLAWVAAAIAGR